MASKLKKQYFLIKIRNIAIVLLLAIFFILDRFLKNFAFKSPGKNFNILGKQIVFSFSKNPNLAFSLPLNNALIIIVNTIIIMVLILLIWQIWQPSQCLVKLNNQNISKTNILALSLIVVGAVSNLLDRFIFSYVIDYLTIVNIIAINIADILISLGALYLVKINWHHFFK